MRSRTPLAPASVAIALSLAAAPAALAQKHGLGAAKSCNPAVACFGGTPTCTTSAIYLDDYGDALLITEAYDIVDPSGAAIRVPNPPESLPINTLTGNAVAIGPPTPDSPLGTFPVLIGPAGSTYESPSFPGFPLPGLPATGYVQVRSDQYSVQPGDPSPLSIETRFRWIDQCDGGGGGGCDPVLNQTAAASAAITVGQPFIKIDGFAEPPFVCMGQPTGVNFFYDVINVGNVAFDEVEAFDGLCGAPAGPFGDDGDLVFEPGEVWSYECFAVVFGAVFDDFVFNALVSGAPECSMSENFGTFIEESPPPFVDLAYELVCEGEEGQIIAEPSGGVPPYSYSWNTGETTQVIFYSVPGKYCVTVTDSLGCEAEDCIFVDVFPSPQVLLESAVVCETDLPHTFCADVAGGFPPFFFQWSTGETTQCIDAGLPGFYDVTVFDGIGCVGFATAQLDVIPEPCCPGDLNGNGSVEFGDLLVLLGFWGPCPGCNADLNGNGSVEFGDLLILLGVWGACPF